MHRAIAATRVRFENILVPTDFSACSGAAVRCAAGLARAEWASVLLLHVISLEPAYPVATEPLPPELLVEANGVGADVADLMSSPELSGLAHRAVVYRGELISILDEIVPTNRIGLIVMGTRGRDGMRKLFVGSVAEQVLRHASCPVLTVGPQADFDYLDLGRYPRVVFATDFSASSLRGLPYAVDLATQNLTLLHVLCTDVASAEYGSTILDPMDYVSARDQLCELAPADYDSDIVVTEGIPAEAIVRTAKEYNASLIVMGVNPKSAFAATHFPWATAHRVICDAHCPVLTVR